MYKRGLPINKSSTVTEKIGLNVKINFVSDHYLNSGVKVSIIGPGEKF
jgi:hypothetical protein